MLTSIKLSWVPPEHGFLVPPSSPDLFLYSLILEPMKTSILQHFSKSVQPAFGRGHQGPRHLHDSLHFHIPSCSLDFTWFYIHLGSITFNTFCYETLHPRCASSLLARSWCATVGAYTASSEYRLYCTTTSSSVSRRSEHAQLLSCSNALQAAGGLWLGEWLSHILGKAC